MAKQRTCVCVILAILTTAAPAADKPLSVKDRLALAEAMKPSLAQVEFTLRFDKGEAPRGSGWAERCANCGSYHGVSLDGRVQEERPYEAPAFILSPTEVLTPDPIAHPRFIKKIEVRFGKQVVKATSAAYAMGQSALLLKLDKPLVGAKPLVFDAKRKGPYLAVTYTETNGAWTVNVAALSMAAATTRDGRSFLSVPSYCLIVDRAGGPVAMSMIDELPPDDAWKGSPKKWKIISAKQMAGALAKLEKRFARGVLRVQLGFRSPKKGSRSGYSRYGSGDDGNSTERFVLGGLIDSKRVLVLANLKPKVTARLERILVHPPVGKPVPAKFAHALKDYGAFIATLSAPLSGALVLSDRKITDFRNQLLLCAEVKLQGERCTSYFWRNRIASFDVGWKRMIFPQVRGSDRHLLLFDRDGKLVAFPIARREKVSVDRSWGGGDVRLTPAPYLSAVLADLSKHVDPNNVPLTEAQENRLAWLGTVLQPLNRELARINKVAHLTRNGEIGALVSYVYPGSPAAKAKIRMGDVVIRLHADDYPKPIDVRIEDRFGGRPFPWARLSTVSEQYFDRIPRPWPSAEDQLARALTDLGFGKPFTLEFARGGKVLRQGLKVVESPPHYDSAPKYKDKKLGLTVRTMTYEVRRYFQKTPGDPGVIISRIEPGSKASVAGLRPYEIITAVNDKPVKTAKDFQKQIAGQSALRLSVKRMLKGRTVKVQMTSSATSKPAASGPAGGQK